MQKNETASPAAKSESSLQPLKTTTPTPNLHSADNNRLATEVKEVGQTRTKRHHPLIPMDRALLLQRKSDYQYASFGTKLSRSSQAQQPDPPSQSATDVDASTTTTSSDVNFSTGESTTASSDVNFSTGESNLDKYRVGAISAHPQKQNEAQVSNSHVSHGYKHPSHQRRHLHGKQSELMTSDMYRESMEQQPTLDVTGGQTRLGKDAVLRMLDNLQQHIPLIQSLLAWYLAANAYPDAALPTNLFQRFSDTITQARQRKVAEMAKELKAIVKNRELFPDIRYHAGFQYGSSTLEQRLSDDVIVHADEQENKQSGPTPNTGKHADDSGSLAKSQQLDDEQNDVSASSAGGDSDLSSSAHIVQARAWSLPEIRARKSKNHPSPRGRLARPHHRYSTHRRRRRRLTTPQRHNLRRGPMRQKKQTRKPAQEPTFQQKNQLRYLTPQ